MRGDYVIRSGPDRGARCRVVQGQENVPGVVNVGSQSIGIELESGERRAVPRDWITKLDSKLGRVTMRNAARERGAR
jgi:hypothetical protein